MSTVSVVIPHWNREDLLEQVLRSLASQTLKPDEVIVVDNGSTDASVECACRHGARVVELGSNHGFSRAVNEGWQSAQSQWVLILNNDVELPPDFLATLLHCAAGNDVWFAVPCLLDARDPNRIDGTFDLLSRGATAWRAGNGQALSSLWTLPRKAWFPPLTAALVRRSLFEQIGGLDERFESYMEDIDFGLRCALSGRTGVYAPDARATHLGSATFGDWDARKVRLISRNQLFLVAKHYPNWWVLRYGWPVLVAQILWGLLAIRNGQTLAWLRGKLDALRLYRQIRQSRAAGSNSNLFTLLRRCESLLWELSPQTSETYWRIYFRLVGRPASRT